MFYPTSGDTAAVSLGLAAVLKRSLTTGQVAWEYADIKGIKPSCAAFGEISNVEKVLHGGFDSGYVFQQESGVDFDGTAMVCRYQTTDYNMGDVGVRKNMQRVI